MSQANGSNSRRISLAALRRDWPLLVSLTLVVFVYAYVVSAGTLVRWPTEMAFFDLQAEAFRAGQLHLKLQPSPELLAQPDPFHPVNRPLWVWDLSLFDGKYFIYWGPVPPLLQAMAKSAFGIDRVIGDQHPTFWFFALAAAFSALLIRRLADLFGAAIPNGLVAIAILGVSLANPLPHLISGGSVYHAAIAAGQAFLLGGLVLASDAVWTARLQRPGVRWRLFGAGAMWALAVGSRVSLVLPIGCILVITVVAVSGPHRERLKRAAGLGLLVAAPLCAMGFGLLLYNNLRFDSWFEFGNNYMLNTMKFRFSSSFWGVNAYSYLLRPFDHDCTFPYLRSGWYMGPRVFPEWMTIPKGYRINEPLVGWMRAVPLTWLGPVALVRAVRPGSAWSGLGVRESEEGSARRVSLLWTVAVFCACATVSGFAFLGSDMATMRYLGDLHFGLTLLGVLGGFLLVASARTGRARALAAGGFALVAAGTIVIGLLFGFQGYVNHFFRHNPALAESYVKALSFCDPNP